MIRAVLLLAGTGARLRPLTDDRPKCLVEFAGKPLLEWQLAALRAVGVRDVIAVTGYKASQVDEWVGKGIARTYHNPTYETTSMVHSLFQAEPELDGEFIIAYGDILYTPAVLEALLESRKPVSVVVDLEWRRLWELRFDNPLADAETLVLGPDDQILEIGDRPQDYSRIMGQYVGLTKFTADGVHMLRRTYLKAQRDVAAGGSAWGTVDDLARADMTHLLRGMISEGLPIQAIPIQGGWLEIDSLSDYRTYERELAENRETEPYRWIRTARDGHDVTGPLADLLAQVKAESGTDHMGPGGSLTTASIVVELARAASAGKSAEQILLDRFSLELSRRKSLSISYDQRWRRAQTSQKASSAVHCLLAAAFLQYPAENRGTALKYVNAAFMALDAADTGAAADTCARLSAHAEKRLSELAAN